MFLNKKQKGYGWYTKVVSKDLNSDAERVGYINFSFKKDCEPTNLNQNGSYVGDLYFIDQDNNKRKVFPVVKEFNGISSIEFKLLETEDNSIDNSKFGGKRSDSASSINISQEDLPWY